MRYIIHKLDLYNLETRIKLEIYMIVRIELSINENIQRPETKTMLNILNISEITRTIYQSTKSKQKVFNI